jgi:hypothetical protein
VQLKTGKNGAEMRKESLTHYFGEMVSAKMRKERGRYFSIIPCGHF